MKRRSKGRHSRYAYGAAQSLANAASRLHAEGFRRRRFSGARGARAPRRTPSCAPLKRRRHMARPVRMHPFCAPRHSAPTSDMLGKPRNSFADLVLSMPVLMALMPPTICEGAVCTRLCDRILRLCHAGTGALWPRALALGRDHRARPSQPSWCPCMWAVVWLTAAHIHAHPWADSGRSLYRKRVALSGLRCALWRLKRKWLCPPPCPSTPCRAPAPR